MSDMGAIIKPPKRGPSLWDELASSPWIEFIDQPIVIYDWHYSVNQIVDGRRKPNHGNESNDVD